MAKLNFEPILNDLAEGKITADEASRRIEELKKVAALAREAQTDSGSSGDDTPADDAYGHDDEPRVRPGGLERVRISSSGRRVRVEGDPTIATLSVEGQHMLRRTGTVMEINATGDLSNRLDGFSLIRPPRVDDLGDIALGKELVVKVNPKLVVDVDMTTGGLKTDKVPLLGRIRVTAGGSTITGVKQIEDLLAQAGGVTIEGPISSGRSRVRVESGSLTVTLAPGANVSVRGSARMGRVSWPGESNEVDEFVVGNGAARLDIGVLMGMATVKVEE